jgi:hypothetical protein
MVLRVAIGRQKEGGMKSKKIQPCTLGLIDLIFGFVRYAEMCHGVVEFPLFTDPLWHLFIYYVNQELVKKSLLEPLNLQFYWIGIRPMISNNGNILCDLDDALFTATFPGRDVDRIRFYGERTARGCEFGKNFTELAEAMFQLSQEIDGFVEVG